ncbi:MFS transporter [Salinisphaera sp. P385]|uniref:MFS transporter n=1 Tax=Spectribacter acetivorans TaxID=3075603 RepID=A0ABU3BBW5_9GAMM|nr:MFS transporter [Salinisphaera sp. P385]MDT0619307.1 MFS transporter [Salinisphaera sp. P385]
MTRSATPPASPVRDLYDLVTGDEDARVCRDISDDACREQPANFFVHLPALFANKAGDLLASPKLTLPWLLGSLGAPPWMLGWLVPLREALALLPQLAVAGWMRRVSVRKWFWVAGAATQGLAAAGMAWTAWSLEGVAAGATLLALLALLSLGRGVASVAYKDVLGKTIAKTRRGTLSGYAASGAGGFALLLSALVLLWPGLSDAPAMLAGLLAMAGLLWLIAAAVFAGLREVPGATSGGGNALTEAWANLRLVRDHPAFARFILVRGLLVSTALGAPFYVDLARQGGGTLTSFAVFLAVSGLADLLGAPWWGRASDRSARRVMIATGLLAALVHLAVAAMGLFHTPTLLLAAAFFALMWLHAGVRLARKTYLVDLADAEHRAAYTAVSNTLIGVLLLVGGGLASLAALLGTPAALTLLALLAIAGSLLAIRLPEVQ